MTVIANECVENMNHEPMIGFYSFKKSKRTLREKNENVFQIGEKNSIFIDKMACQECCCCCHLKIFSRNACDIEWNISNHIMLVTWFPVNVHKQVILSQIHVFTHDQHFLFLASDTYYNVYKFQFDASEKFYSNTNSIIWFIKFPRNLFFSFENRTR